MRFKAGKRYEYIYLIEPYWDPKRQEQLERCLKIRDAASRILSIAQNPLQQLEAAKTLLVSNAQLLTCLRELQRDRVIEVTKSFHECRNSSNTHFNFRQPATTDWANNFAQDGKARLCLSSTFWLSQNFALYAGYNSAKLVMSAY
ncbi:unnamed protein product [Protopolystoma xenopodis]|uniref:Uncharacterized protein n=1 Tax=Protopolystoma xenopodis TaxID=117903 RepID=A0A3S5AZT1_9PLAT|nr:unnamed protein product [Protopolystoma xenopodis]